MFVCACAESLIPVQFFATPWTVAFQAPLSMGFSRQAYWSGWPFPPPGHLPYQGSNTCLLLLPHWQVDSLPLPIFQSPTESVFSNTIDEKDIKIDQPCLLPLWTIHPSLQNHISI